MNDYELDMDAEGLPEEPVRDPWTYDAPGAGTIVLFTLLGSLSVGGVVALAWGLAQKR